MRVRTFVPLVTSQRWKLWLCALAFAAVGSCYVWPAALANFFGTTSTMLKLA